MFFWKNLKILQQADDSNVNFNNTNDVDDDDIKGVNGSDDDDVTKLREKIVLFESKRKKTYFKFSLQKE